MPRTLVRWVLAASLLASVLPAAEVVAAPPPPVPCPGCWHPGLVTSWQIQFTGTIDTTVNAVMFDLDGFDTQASTVAGLHGQGKKAVCYLSAGTWENWRPDKAAFPKSVLGRSNGWPGEKWLDIRQLSILGPIMEARMDRCVAKGFDAVEFDNVDGYANQTGFKLTGAHQLAYNRFLAGEAHERGLSAGLKNDLGQIGQLVAYFDFAINEQCFFYDECELLLPFIRAGKPVFQIEYELEPAEFCARANSMNFNSLVKRFELDAYRVPCR